MKRSCFTYVCVLTVAAICVCGCSKDDAIAPAVVDSTDIGMLMDRFILEMGIDSNTVQIDENGIYLYPIDVLPGRRTQAEGQILSLYYDEHVFDGQALADSRRISLFDEGDGLPIRVKQGVKSIYPVGLDLALAGMNEGDEYGFVMPWFDQNYDKATKKP